MPCRLVSGSRRFGGSQCLNLGLKQLKKTQSQYFLDCLTLKVKTPRSFETSGNTSAATPQHIPEYLKPSNTDCKNVKSLRQRFLRSKVKFTSLYITALFGWLLVALLKVVCQLLATLRQQFEHHLHLARCEGRTQGGSHVLPGLT